MKCDNCKKEPDWLEIIGPQYICRKCINKSKLMGLILRTSADTFKYVVKKLELKTYQELMAVDRKRVEQVCDLRKNGIFLKTTNKIEIE